MSSTPERVPSAPRPLAAGLALLMVLFGPLGTAPAAARALEVPMKALPEMALTAEERDVIGAHQGFECPQAWIFTQDPETAQKIAAELAEAARAFKTYFGESPRKGIVWDGSELEADQSQALQGLGAAWIVLSPIVDARSLGAMRHELGHLWFIHQVWRGQAERSPGLHYGCSAPDWLDEVAAILVEDERTRSGRRRSFARHVRRNGPVLDSRDLVDFLEAPHPGTFDHEGIRRAIADWRERALREDLSHGALRIALGDDESARRLDEFYGQCRSLADYLIERTGDPKVFRSLSLALRDGLSLEEWLRSRPGNSLLPSNLHRLALDWWGWARLRAYEIELAAAE